MSDTDRDKRGRPRSDKRCPESQSGGCVYCRTGEFKHSDSRKRRKEGKREARQAF